VLQQRRRVYDRFRAECQVTPAKTHADYLAAPVGKWFGGRTFLHFFADPTLCGLVLWGRSDEDDVRAMAQAIDAELPSRTGMHRSIVDAHRITGVDPAAFAHLSAHMAERRHVYGDNVSHHALVRPGGAVGAMVAGFYSVTPAGHPDRIRVFDSTGDALAWLGLSAAASKELQSALDGLVAAAGEGPRMLQALRRHIEANEGRVTLRDAARAMAVSTRTLQERLHEAGTSLRDEIAAARVRAAQVLLADTDAKLTTIALEVGCASLQHFSTLFRKVTGESPSAFRARRRK
jgi:AraC-like DNA-binding protein